MADHKSYQLKAVQLRLFIDERSLKLNKSIVVDSDKERVKFLSGERRQFVETSLEILQKYVDKFFEIRKSDIEDRFDDVRGGTGSNSYAKHMRPNMINEFDHSYKTLINYLNYDVFADKITISNSATFLPRIAKNGSIRYNDEKVEKKDKEVYVYNEICEKVGPVYASSLIFHTKKEPQKYKPIVSGNDSWNDKEEPNWRFKMTIPKVIDGKWVNTFKYEF